MICSSVIVVMGESYHKVVDLDCPRVVGTRRGRYPSTMGLRDRLKKSVVGVVNRLSGEHSSAAPEEIKPMERPGKPDPDAQIKWARLNRPKESGGSDS